MTTVLVGDIYPGRCKWKGGTLAHDGNIYAMPWGASQILKISTINDSISLLRKKFTTPLENNNDDNFHDGGQEIEKRQWCGSVLGPDGCVYGIPSLATKILKLDPRNIDLSLVGCDLKDPLYDYNSVDDDHEHDDQNNNNNEQEQYASAVLGPDNKLYFIPDSARKILQYDTITGITALIGDDFGSGNEKWLGAVLAPEDNCIYCVPSNARQALKFDPKDQSTTLIGQKFSVNNMKWDGAVLGPDGCAVYGIPSCHDHILKIDVVTQTTTLIKSTNIGNDEFKWSGGCLGNDDCIYFIPCDARHVLKFDPFDESTMQITTNLGSKDEKWDRGVLGEHNGCIYAIPHNAKQVLKIDTNSSTIISDAEEIDEGMEMMRELNLKLEEKNIKLQEKNLCLEEELLLIKEQLQISKNTIDEKLRIEEKYNELHAQVVARDEILNGENLMNKSIRELNNIEEQLGNALKATTQAKMKKVAEEEHDRYCVICLTATKSVLLQPCNHLCLCRECSERDDLTECPICRREITKKINGIYF